MSVLITFQLDKIIMGIVKLVKSIKNNDKASIPIIKNISFEVNQEKKLKLEICWKPTKLSNSKKIEIVIIKKIIDKNKETFFI